MGPATEEPGISSGDLLRKRGIRGVKERGGLDRMGDKG